MNTTIVDIAYTPENTGPATTPVTTPATMPATTPATAAAGSPATSASKSKKRRRSTVEVRQSAPAPKTTASATAEPVSKSYLWHRRFAHLHPAALPSLIDGFAHDDTMCDVCVQAKHKQKSIRTKVKRATMSFELVHSDVCGPFSAPTGGSSCYHHFILFIDDYTRWVPCCLIEIIYNDREFN